MAETLLYAGTLVVSKCWCGIRFAMPQELDAQAHRDGRTTYCPLGHAGVYGDTTEKENKRLRERLEAEKENVRFWRERERHAERRAIAQRGVTTKLKKRIASGVCPCCKRTFQDVARHMKGQHPNYLEAQNV